MGCVYHEGNSMGSLLDSTPPEAVPSQPVQEGGTGIWRWLALTVHGDVHLLGAGEPWHPSHRHFTAVVAGRFEGDVAQFQLFSVPQ